jgi:transposase
MEEVYRCCAGVDVHKQSVTVNVLRRGVEGKEDLEEVRTFGTMSKDLFGLAAWLEEVGCTHMAMESTGVYWKPIYNIMSAEGFGVMLVNAQHIKNVRGRKTDVQDCQWIAQLLQHGLLQGSFIPPEPIRELRDLTRQRKKLVSQRASCVQRIQKVLEDANIKLSSVATNIVGVSGWKMLEKLVSGESDAQKLAELARGRLKSKKEKLADALEGRLTEHHRFLLRHHMREIRFLDEMVGDYDERIELQVQPFSEYIPLLDSIPGVNETAAAGILGEIGADMNQFPDHAHLNSWAGICPGNNESAGKHRSGKARNGNAWLRTLLVEVAWAASNKRGSYFRTQYRRLASRRGRKRALVAVGHSILTVAYHVMKYKTTYRELGEDFFEKLNGDRLRKHYMRILRCGPFLLSSGSAMPPAKQAR